jgi:hypothetical protein
MAVYEFMIVIVIVMPIEWNVCYCPYIEHLIYLFFQCTNVSPTTRYHWRPTAPSSSIYDVVRLVLASHPAKISG